MTASGFSLLHKYTLKQTGGENKESSQTE